MQYEPHPQPCSTNERLQRTNHLRDYRRFLEEFAVGARNDNEHNQVIALTVAIMQAIQASDLRPAP